MGGWVDGDVSDGRLRSGLGGVVVVALRPAGEETEGRESAVDLRSGALGDDQLSGVPVSGLADWERSDGVALQDDDESVERSWSALGHGQRGSCGGVDVPDG